MDFSAAAGVSPPLSATAGPQPFALAAAAAAAAAVARSNKLDRKQLKKKYKRRKERMEALQRHLGGGDATTSEGENEEVDEEDDGNDLDSTEENDVDLKPLRPPRKHKVKEIEAPLKEPLYEEDIVEGFSFAAFKTYEDLQVGQDAAQP